MNWKEKLVALYLHVCRCYDTKLCLHCQRMSNNFKPAFTDQEVLTLFLFGIMQGRFKIKDIYNYGKNHLDSWFPDLPSYQAFNSRLNRMAEVFPVLIEYLSSYAESEGINFNVSLIDSMPIVLANAKRSQQAKVAKGLCNKGRCASKNMYYYGVKLHVMGFRRSGTIPLPEYIGLTPASDNDLTIFRTIAPLVNNREIYADKAYADRLLNQLLEEKQNTTICTPVKKKKGQEELTMFAKLLSTGVSRVRQPIESLFNWLEEKVAIQTASKVRSENGLKVHVFGRLAAAIFMLVFPVFNS